MLASQPPQGLVARLAVERLHSVAPSRAPAQLAAPVASPVGNPIGHRQPSQPRPRWLLSFLRQRKYRRFVTGAGAVVLLLIIGLLFLFRDAWVTAPARQSRRGPPARTDRLPVRPAGIGTIGFERPRE